MPIIFFGKQKDKEELELEIAKSGKPLVIYDSVNEEGVGKRLSIAPNSAYGLLGGFDYDVLTVIYDRLYKITQEIGTCPFLLRLPLSEFPKIMRQPVSGQLYERVKISVKRISSLAIYHENFVKIKDDGGDLRTYQENALNLFQYEGMYKEEIKNGKDTRLKKLYIDLTIPEWQRNNINNNYTTEFDIEFYFSLGSYRAKRLYRFLELIRWEKHSQTPIKKLEYELRLQKLPNNFKKRAIKRAFQELIEHHFLESFDFTEWGVAFIFHSVKHKKRTELVKALELDYRQRSLVDQIVSELKDEKSRRWYEFLTSRVPEDILYKCLSLTKETAEISGINKSRGAVFTDHVKRECNRMGIDISCS
jgi:hypothetical protein